MARRAIARTALVFAATLAVGALVVQQSAALVRDERRRAATAAAMSAADVIESQLGGSLAAPYALAAAVRQSGGDVRDFERLAGELLDLFGGIDSLQLAPDGVIRHIHPLPGNEPALGLDLLNDPFHRPSILRAQAARRVQLFGPFALRQGGTGLAARVAVFVEAPGGEERFWGIASAIVGLPRLLDAAAVERLASAGYEYELRTSGGTLVASSASGRGLEDAVTARLHLPGDAWTLAVAPQDGWGAGRELLLESLLALAVAVAVTALAYRLIRVPDVLARQVAERTAALRQASTEREALLRGMPDPAWLKDRDHRFVAVNDALAALARRSPAEMIGRTHAEVFGIAGSEDVDRHDREVLASGVQLVAEEWVQGPHGAPLRYEVVKRAYHDAGGAIAGTVGIARDVTERRNLEDRLRQADKMEAIGRLAGGIAHDFNNILTVVLGSATELRDAAPDADTRELAAEVVDGAQRAAALTRQLLAFSRRQPLQPRDVDLNETVRGFERMLRRVISEDVTIVTRLHAGPAVVRADPGQLEQVLLNLVVNARDAMPRGGQVVVETGLVDRAPPEAGLDAHVPCVLLSVRDTGHGLDDVARAHLFEPFFTTKGVGEGTGLGLATVFGIVKQSGGGIAVDSARGAGTDFRVYLPRVDRPPTATQRDGVVRARGTETVLVVEDDPAVRGLVRRALEAAGFSVIEAQNADEALRAAAGRDDVDVLLTDMVMPGRSGRELALALLRRDPALRVVFVSGYTEDATLRSGALPAGQVFLAKPFTGDAVAAAVRAALDAPAAARLGA